MLISCSTRVYTSSDLVDSNVHWVGLALVWCVFVGRSFLGV